jgi:hypothetical protein
VDPVSGVDAGELAQPASDACGSFAQQRCQLSDVRFFDPAPAVY